MAIDSANKFPGKPPKSAAQIRSVLKHVHGANAESASAIPAGTAHDEIAMWVTAAEFRRRRLAYRFESLLLQRQIPAHVAKRGAHWFVDVLAVDLREAIALHRRARQRNAAREARGPQGEQPAAPTVPYFGVSLQALILLSLFAAIIVVAAATLAFPALNQLNQQAPVITGLGGAFVVMLTFMVLVGIMIRRTRGTQP